MEGARQRTSSHHGPWVLVAGALLGLTIGCVRIGAFPCERDSQCELDGVPGRCFEPGYCALPDGSCESGYRFHERSSPEDLAGRCTDPPAAESTGMGSSTGAASSSSGVGSSSGTASSGTDSSTGGSSTTGSDCGDHPCACSVSLAAGTNHTCVARTDGKAICWGANGLAELGLGTASTPIPWPQEVATPEQLVVLSIHDGNNHTCGLMADDSVWCWGRNTSGEIAPRMAAADVLGPTLLPLVEPPGAIGLAPAHTCVGSPVSPAVRCLGNNGNGKLGGTGPDPIDGAIPGKQAIDQLALGRDHSCARAGGQVWCWGRNNFGQLGDPMVMDESEAPVEVALPGEATFLVGGRDHSCVALDDGPDVVCWGRNFVGQIGDGTTATAEEPTALVEPLPAAVITMDGRLDTTCALLANAELWCWGGNYGEELGTGVEPDTPLLVPMRVEVTDELPPEETVVELAVGASHLCVRAESGRVWCWGRDNNEQLGPIDPPVGMRAVEIDVECPEGEGG